MAAWLELRPWAAVEVTWPERKAEKSQRVFFATWSVKLHDGAGDGVQFAILIGSRTACASPTQPMKCMESKVTKLISLQKKIFKISTHSLTEVAQSSPEQLEQAGWSSQNWLVGAQFESKHWLQPKATTWGKASISHSIAVTTATNVVLNFIICKKDYSWKFLVFLTILHTILKQLSGFPNHFGSSMGMIVQWYKLKQFCQQQQRNKPFLHSKLEAPGPETLQCLRGNPLQRSLCGRCVCFALNNTKQSLPIHHAIQLFAENFCRWVIFYHCLFCFYNKYAAIEGTSQSRLDIKSTKY